MFRKLAIGLEAGLFFLLVVSLYLLALGLLPLFREASGLFILVFLDGAMPLSPPTFIYLSSLLFALAGALMVHWLPAFSSRQLSAFWLVTYLFYWVDPLIGLWGSAEVWKSVAAWGLGAATLGLIFWMVTADAPEGETHFQPPSLRSRLAGGWLIVWMGFFAGISSVLLSEVPLYFWRRLPLSLMAFGMAGWAYVLSGALRKTQGEEEAGVTSTWRWLIVAWVALALLNYFFRIQTSD
jgi:hypothetical protein